MQAGRGGIQPALRPDRTATPTLNLNVSPTSVNFGQVQTGHNSPNVNITLSNPASGSAQTISSVSLAIGTQFSIASNNCTGKKLNPGQNCNVQVSFRPKVSGAASDTLSFTDTASNSPQTVSLSGSGN